tara:strand:- start:2265 stop:2585 length:321 start_codon:yes stop_codon:yes gene_type:complete
MATKAQNISKVTEKLVKKAMAEYGKKVDPLTIKKGIESYQRKNPDLIGKIEAKNKAFKTAYGDKNPAYDIFSTSIKKIDASIPKLKKGKYVSVKCKLGRNKKTRVT